MQKLSFENKLTTGNIGAIAVIIFGLGGAWVEYHYTITQHEKRLIRLETNEIAANARYEAAEKATRDKQDELKERLVEIRIEQAVAKNKLQAIEVTLGAIDKNLESIRRASEDRQRPAGAPR